MASSFRRLPDTGGDPYRGMERVDLDLEAREYDAVTAFGRWRMGVKSTWITAACVTGGIVGAVGFFAIQKLQFALINRAWVAINVVGFVVPFVTALGVGLVVARMRTNAGTDRMVDQLSERHQIDRARLAEVVHQICGL